ncbi:hypothetical protein AUR64_14000 [Haloprofundus marisrubri]|uniref:UspA domain-containing protein n=1 Tax=Haloprofundus marisrubri TaxID=1514971 RepID=A0A0W1R739_9EURY|nr:universal stress protein [Haloprofundus marisrubri]KTG08919.1 hypothetical protein AUR64_14000 [Haloprofundus marisrubri]
MYDTILVATDGSPSATAAADRAIDFARTFDAGLHALYVIDTMAYGADVRSDLMTEALGQQGESAVEAVELAAEETGVAVTTAVTRGSPAQAIVDYVEDNDIDLVVVGTRGRRGLERFLVGSVAERVVRTSPAPVVTVPPDGASTDDV